MPGRRDPRGEISRLEQELHRVRDEKGRLHQAPPPAPGTPRDHNLHDLEARERDLMRQIENLRRR